MDIKYKYGYKAVDIFIIYVYAIQLYKSIIRRKENWN